MPTDDVVRGLLAPRKHLPCRLLWDARGAELFARICTLEDYYPTRHELALLREHLPAIARTVGPRARVIEPGSGIALKTRLLLDALEAPAGYVAIEVEAEQLAAASAALQAAYPALDLQPLCADYMVPFTLPPARREFARSLVFFPGSTIGNFELDEAEAFLGRFAAQTEPGALLLLGADANSDPETLVRAYDDREGVTAEFDLNVLVHLDREYQGDFDPRAFSHRAVWDPQHHRIEMHLVSERDQQVHVLGQAFELRRGEPIVTEHCHKYPPPVIEALLGRAGWRLQQMFADPRGWMRLWLCERA